MKMKWIKCSEQMPNEDQEVLIFIPECTMQFVGCLFKGTFVTCGYEACKLGENPTLDRVSHWMLLPEDPTNE